MTTQLLSRPTRTGTRPWPLELDAEVAPSTRTVSARQAQALAELLGRIEGVQRATADPHCGGRFVLVRITVMATDLADAADRACAFLHSSAIAAGLSPLVLVAARFAR
jgi:hypothetical protein